MIKLMKVSNVNKYNREQIKVEYCKNSNNCDKEVGLHRTVHIIYLYFSLNYTILVLEYFNNNS